MHSDDKETGDAARSSRNEDAEVSLGVTRKDKIRNEHIRGALSVDRIWTDRDQTVKAEMVRS